MIIDITNIIIGHQHDQECPANEPSCLPSDNRHEELKGRLQHTHSGAVVIADSVQGGCRRASKRERVQGSIQIRLAGDGTQPEPRRWR